MAYNCYNYLQMGEVSRNFVQFFFIDSLVSMFTLKLHLARQCLVH